VGAGYGTVKERKIKIMPAVGLSGHTRQHTRLYLVKFSRTVYGVVRLKTNRAHVLWACTAGKRLLR
jgi:hypothetical protein